MQMGLEEIQLGLHREFHLSVSIGVSAVRRGWRLCPRASHGAVEALEQRILDGPMHLYFEGKLPSRTSLEEYPCGSGAPPAGQDLRRGWRKGKAAFRRIFDSLKNSPPEQALLYFHRLYFHPFQRDLHPGFHRYLPWKGRSVCGRLRM